MQAATLEEWGTQTLERLLSGVRDARRAFRAKPKSARRVHELRKSLARLKAAIEDLEPLHPGAREIYDETKRLHKRAGKVRDADVMLAKLRDFDAKEVETLCAMLRKRRKKANRKLRAAMEENGL